MLKRLLVLSLLVLVVLATAEAYARFALGLGDPPLMERHSTIEYLHAPGTFHRFGNTLSFNAAHMRADPPPTSGDTLRVLVIGDSVVNGGALTDDMALGTRVAQQRLTEELGRPVWVGNASAGSWGPGNMLAYLQEYGAFGADIIILVLSSHDLTDVPQFPEELGPEFPSRRPVLAVEEAVLRYLPRYVPALRAEPTVPSNVDQGPRLLAQLLEESKSAATHVVVLQHFERDEQLGDPGPSALARQFEVSGADSRPMRDVLSPSHYRDTIHLNDEGHAVYASEFVKLVLAAVR